ncbi:hypothetical protein BDM02DRAFT_3189444 [Thelephora ganbajun]|uniref:Uncharacterized protein n=1 Tax=Thelephora ganbajun TaxID=370292 RepID=A0ACB6Z8Z4_THEGA|nr:hypothetical protein BDM02DRAFT_3189444 [Thelephora ganbajun]
MTNLLGAFFSSYHTTASFSAIVLKARCHAPPPLPGLFTAALIVLSLYALTSVFYYVLTAGLAAVIISSALSLVDGSEGVHYWHISRPSSGSAASSPQYSLEPTARLVLRYDDKGNESTREVFIPLDLDKEGVFDVKAVVKSPAPWVVIYRLGEFHLSERVVGEHEDYGIFQGEREEESGVV